MPKVDGVEFPYTEAGMQKAKAWAAMTGKPMKMDKEYQSGGRVIADILDPSSLEEVAHKPIESGSRQAVRYKAKTKGGDDRHIVRDIAGLANKEQKRQLSTMGLRDAIKNNPGFADTLSAEDATDFMNMNDEVSIWDLLKKIVPSFEQGGEIPAGRRMYDTKKKKKTVMQTSTEGMPVRGETYENGGEVKTPSYKKISNEDLKQMAIDGDSKAKNTLYKRLRRKEVGKSALKWGLGSAGLLKGLDVLNQKHGPEYGKSDSPLNLLSLVIPGLMGAGFGALKGLGHEKVYEKYRDVEPETPITLKEAKSFKKGGKVKMPKGYHT